MENIMKKLVFACFAVLANLTPPAAASEPSANEPVILINAFIVPDGKEAEAVSYWEQAAEFMKAQPGYISTALHKAILPDAKFRLVNIAKWESSEAFMKASHRLRTTAGLKPIDGVVPTPSLYTVIISD